MKAAVFTGILNIGVRTHIEALLRENIRVDLYLEDVVGPDPSKMLRTKNREKQFKMHLVESLPRTRATRVKHVLKYAGLAVLKTPSFYMKFLRDISERSLHSKGSLLLTARLLSRISRKTRSYDILHAHSATTGRRVALMHDYNVLHGKLVVSFKGMDAQVALGRGEFYRYRKMIEVIDACTVQTEYMRNVVHKLGVPHHKIVKIPSSVDLERFSLRSDEELSRSSHSSNAAIRIITVARFVEVKGHAYGIEAIAQLIREGYNIEYTLVGSGPLFDKIRKQAHDAGIIERTRFLGNVDLERVYEEIHAHDIFFLPGIVDSDGAAEAMGLVSLEAQYIGLPVVLSRVGGLPETVADENSAILIESQNSKAAAEGIKDLLRRRDEWPEMVRKNRRYVKTHFSIQSTSAKYLKLYNELLQGTPITTYAPINSEN